MNDSRPKGLVSVACAAGRCNQCRGRVLVDLQAERSKDRWDACTHHCHRKGKGRRKRT